MRRQTKNGNKFSRQRGEAILEAAFVGLLILFMTFGILDFSRAMYAYHWVSYAAREGTRWASVRGADCPTSNPLPGGCPATAAQVQTFVQSIVAPAMFSAACSGGNSNAGCASVTTTWSGKGGDGTDCTNGGATPTNSPGCVVKVQVDYIFGFILPVSSVTGKIIDMQSISQMVISQ
jgi:Flp pilus assembly protein TadG